MKKNITWVGVADHQRARVLMNGGPGRGLLPVAAMNLQTHLKAGRDIVTDRPGRSFESKGNMRHAMQPRVDPHRQAAERFVERVAKALTAACSTMEWWSANSQPPSRARPLRAQSPPSPSRRTPRCSRGSTRR